MSSNNFYTTVKLDRLDPLRGDPQWLEKVLYETESKILLLWRNKYLMQGEQGLLNLSPKQCTDFIEQADERIFLGRSDAGIHWFALDFSSLAEDQRPSLNNEEAQWRDMRSVAPLLDRETAALMGYPLALMRWHRRHRFCGSCGHPTKTEHSGHTRRCTNEACKLEHYPRTDPAIIVLIEDGDRLLLGHQSWWNDGMHSLLAGYVEPGECLEDAVHREVFEEAGIQVKNIQYHSSQPWPYSSSIMLGFCAQAKTTNIQVNTNELESADWFSLEQLQQHETTENFSLSRKDSISRVLIDEWIRQKNSAGGAIV